MNVKCKMLNMSMLGVLVSGMVLAAPTVLAKTVNVTMTAKEVELEIDNKGTKYSAWTYDGMIPGQVVRVK